MSGAPFFTADPPARIPPHSYDTEQQLLGALLMDNRQLESIGQALHPEHFAEPTHGRIYETIARLVAAGRRADPVTLAMILSSDPGLAELGGPAAYLVGLVGSVVMPLVAQGLGIDKNELLLTMAAMQRAGVLSTKSGTWVNQGLTREFVDTAVISGHASEKQREALKELGLVGANGKSTVIDAEGNLSMIKLARALHEAKQHFDKLYGPMAGAHMVAAETQAFGTQGGRFMGMLGNPAMSEQLPELEAAMARMPEAQQFFKDMFDASPAQEARTATADFNRVLMDLASDAMPAATAALKQLDQIMKWADGQGDGTKTAVVGGAIAAPFVGWAAAKKVGAAAWKLGGRVKWADEIEYAAKALGSSDFVLPMAAGVAFHFADPKDRIGTLVDTNIPGASWLDNAASHVRLGSLGSLGRSYAEQQAAAEAVGVAVAKALDGVSVQADGQELGRLVTKYQSREAQKPPTSMSGFDLRLSPGYPTGGGF